MAVPSVAFLAFFLLVLSPTAVSSFLFPSFEKTPVFSSEIVLLGDAKIDGADSSINIVRPFVPSSGRIFYKKPIHFLEHSRRKIASFSTDFSFSVSPGIDGIALVVLPVEAPLDGRFFGPFPGSDYIFSIEFNTSRDADFDVGPANGTHSRVLRIHNASAVGLALISGEKLHSWIDYDSDSEELEVRLSRSGGARPMHPLTSRSVNLSEILKGEMFVGISSSSRNSTQSSKVYSWSFTLRRVLPYLHSEPLDPQAFLEHREHRSIHWKSHYFWRFLTALIFGVGCGAAVAVVVLFLWSVFIDRRSMVPPEVAVHPVDFDYEKITPVGMMAPVGIKDSKVAEK